MYEAENTFRFKGFQIFPSHNNKGTSLTVGLLWNTSAVQNSQNLCCHCFPLFIYLLCLSPSDCDCGLCSYFSFFFQVGVPLFIPNLALFPKGLICTPPALSNTLSIICASASASPNPHQCHSFRFQASVFPPLWASSYSCQDPGAVSAWLYYHIAPLMQLSPVWTERNPVSYWPLMFNETEV